MQPDERSCAHPAEMCRRHEAPLGVAKQRAVQRRMDAPKRVGCIWDSQNSNRNKFQERVTLTKGIGAIGTMNGKFPMNKEQTKVFLVKSGDKKSETKGEGLDFWAFSLGLKFVQRSLYIRATESV